jgi:hypothetical protein
MRMPGEIGTLETGRRADVLVVDGDPSADVTILGQRTRFRHVISRGAEVGLSRPWPERRLVPGEKVREFASRTLTPEVAQELSPDIVANA